MKTIAFVLYPGLTPLDLIGPLQVLASLRNADPSFEATVVAETLDPAASDTPLSLVAERTFDDVPAPYALVVPGGQAGTLRALTNERLLDYVRSAAAQAEVTASVCTGSLILGAAGLLKGREATTHWSFLEALREFDATPVKRRWVDEGAVLTAAGVSAGIDMALHLVARFTSEEVAKAVQFGIEYDPEPPFGGLDWAAAPRQMFAGAAAAWIKEALSGAPDLAARLAARV
ncbi:thiazole biosynthesis protein ThiJ [Amycolatopsis deserti]|uniref:Thiazole biosynthesis protein ThiJ n=1 Tax=Amycolatopsis deserti TaxID=185696 RepID=A0ABQ3JEI6_9PSEU|nr:DJ-1/PfpI family protein [Amycolatopsis deserti]GHF18654.1 thiazole biosynthesis protein ThiJ [Amycolatopsis deserti]